MKINTTHFRSTQVPKAIVKMSVISPFLCIVPVLSVSYSSIPHILIHPVVNQFGQKAVRSQLCFAFRPGYCSLLRRVLLAEQLNGIRGARTRTSLPWRAGVYTRAKRKKLGWGACWPMSHYSTSSTVVAASDYWQGVGWPKGKVEPPKRLTSETTDCRWEGNVLIFLRLYEAVMDCHRLLL